MATDRYYTCSKCETEQWAGNLFEALRSAAHGSYPPCPKCGTHQNLRLVFPFGLGAGTRKRKVVAAYCQDPPVTWQDEKGLKVEFFPFLVVTEELDDPDRRAIWLPYWHLHYRKTSPHRKYGQWAPHMDVRIFADLVARARKDGHF